MKLKTNFGEFSKSLNETAILQQYPKPKNKMGQCPTPFLSNGTNRSDCASCEKSAVVLLRTLGAIIAIEKTASVKM